MYSDSGSTVASVVPAFSKRGDLIICDQHVNDNLLTGMLLSRSKIIVYKHNDMNDLERILVEIKRKDAKTGNSPKTQRRFIVSEGLFRNTGQIVNLPVLNKLKKEHGCRLILDESLSFGVLGKTGRGVSEHFNMSIDSIDILASSLATSLGSVGGFCIGNEREVVDQAREFVATVNDGAQQAQASAQAAIGELQHRNNSLMRELEGQQREKHLLVSDLDAAR